MGNVPKLRFPEFSGEWEEKKLSNTLKIKHGKDQRTIEHSNGIYPILATSGIIGYTNTAIYKKETVLIGRKGTINKPQYMSTPFWTIDTLFYSEIHAENYVKFIYYLFQTINWLEYNEASGVPSLSAATIENIKVSIPSLPEQTKIANFLTLFDKKIEKQSEKVAALEEYKKGLMQKIFSREIRFKDDEGKDYPEWEIKKAKKLFYNISDKNHNGDLEVLSVTQDRGTVIRKELSIDIKYDRANLKNYKRVKRNNFIISLRSFQGGIDRSSHDGLVSPAYTIFDLTEPEMHDPRYYGLLFKSKNYINRLNTLIYGIRDGKAIGFNDFSELPIHYPSKFEQTKIANFLTLFDRKIEKEKAKLEALREQKKGLLQQMFV